jgi:hypothetical protein
MSTVSHTRRVAPQPSHRLATLVTALCTLAAIAAVVVLLTSPRPSGTSTTSQRVLAGQAPQIQAPPLQIQAWPLQIQAPPPQIQARPLQIQAAPSLPSTAPYPRHVQGFGPVQ